MTEEEAWRRHRVEARPSRVPRDLPFTRNTPATAATAAIGSSARAALARSSSACWPATRCRRWARSCFSLGTRWGGCGRRCWPRSEAHLRHRLRRRVRHRPLCAASPDRSRRTRGHRLKPRRFPLPHTSEFATWLALCWAYSTSCARSGNSGRRMPPSRTRLPRKTLAMTCQPARASTCCRAVRTPPSMGVT
jgi:hypothetical protein